MDLRKIVLIFSYPILTVLSIAYIVVAYHNTVREPIISTWHSIAIGLLVLGAWPLTFRLKKHLENLENETNKQ